MDKTYKVGCYYKVLVGEYRGLVGVCTRLASCVSTIELQIGDTSGTIWFRFDEVEMIPTKVNYIGKTFKVNDGKYRAGEIGTCFSCGNDGSCDYVDLKLGNTGSVRFTINAVTEVKTDMKPKHDSFYLVWSPSGKTPPTFRHTSQYDAEVEAKRLASSNPGTEFFVLETKYSVVNGKTEEKNFTAPDNTNCDQPPF